MLTIRKGNALAMRINGHRSGWDGSICSNPTAWDCGGPLRFRRDNCDQGRSNCFHIDLFNDVEPSLLIDYGGADWILADDVNAMNDQIALFYNRPFEEPGGIANQMSLHQIYGAYRIESIEKVTLGYHDYWRVRPYKDGWARLQELKIQLPRYGNLRGQYIKEIDRNLVARMFTEARQKLTERPELVPSESHRLRIDHFIEHMSEWLDQAAEKVATPSGGQTRRFVAESGGGTRSSAFEDLKNSWREPKSESNPTATASASTYAAQNSDSIVPCLEVSPTTVPDRRRLVDPSMRAAIAQNFGATTLQSLEVASITKPFLILRGGPGVGKSTLATSLLDDSPGERSIIIPVGSTWRGREDLLGYVNPLNGKFEATPFTRFLIKAEQAWDAGDKQTRIAILEELNLSQPEYWLSDILVRIEYRGDDRVRRTIDLGGSGTTIDGEETRTGVFITPAVRFVATINTDHTTKKLSPRVLDRSAVIELTVDPATVIERLEIDLSSDQVDAIQDLDFLVQSKGAAFSYRSALSLKACLALGAELELDEWSALDYVVVHEVLSKIQLLAGDTSDAMFMELAMDWRQKHDSGLPMSAAVIEKWRDALEVGRDVIQA